jgi:hypothetical protein
MNAVSIIKYVFTLIGAAMLIGTVYWFQSTRAFIASAATAEGTVVDLVQSRSSNSTMYSPVVRYNTATGELIEFVSSVSSNPPGYHKGEKVEVMYSPSEPSKASINTFFNLWFGHLILGGLGSVFFLTGGGIMVAAAMKARQDEYLKTQGTPIETTFQSVELNTSLRVNGRSPFRVVTQWQNPATSKLHVFESENLWFDPTSYIQGNKITVFIKPDNPKKYYVDVSFLPKLSD